MSHDFETRIKSYEMLLANAVVLPSYTARLAAFYDKYEHNQPRYDEVSKVTNVPSCLIAAIHAKEASSRFDCNLHNGQPLNMVTTIVPKGRGPFKTWEDSAIDALGMEAYLISKISTYGEIWSTPQCLYFAESYNGFGYRAHEINSPYLWCGTNHYTKGGYSSDWHYDPNHVVKNIGVAAILINHSRSLT